MFDSRYFPLQLGHQAAQCSVGTVNWRAMYGEHAFIHKKPVFPSDIYAKQKAKQIDFEELEKRAKEYALAKEEGRELPEEPQQPAKGVAPPPVVKPPEEDGLAPGWAIARDAQGRVYYWHTETKQVQWTKPTVEAADAATNGNGAQEAAAGKPTDQTNEEQLAAGTNTTEEPAAMETTDAGGQ